MAGLAIWIALAVATLHIRAPPTRSTTSQDPRLLTLCGQQQADLPCPRLTQQLLPALAWTALADATLRIRAPQAKKSVSEKEARPKVMPQKASRRAEVLKPTWGGCEGWRRWLS